MSINLNNSYWVKLSAVGKHSYIEYYRRLGLDTPCNMYNADGWIRMPLYDIAHIFGHKLTIGLSDLPFEDMNLYETLDEVE